MCDYEQTYHFGALQNTVEAIATGEPELILRAEDDALTALSSVGSLLNVVADYANMRASNPRNALYANDDDLAEAIFLASDVTNVIHSALLRASNVRSDRRFPKTSKES